MVEGSSGTFYKGTQIFYALIDFEGLNPTNNNEQQNASREIIRWGGYTPEPQTTCGYLFSITITCFSFTR